MDKLQARVEQLKRHVETKERFDEKNTQQFESRTNGPQGRDGADEGSL